MRSASFAALLPILAGIAPSMGQAVQAPYSSQYTLVDLGIANGLGTPIGGLTIKHDDTGVLLVAGKANSHLGTVYSVGIRRNEEGHIVGFAGEATGVASAASIDGGLSYGPGHVLFYGRYPTTTIGQIKSGSAVTDRVVDLASMGVPSAPSCVTFVPAGFPGEGRCKVTTYPGGQWWDLTLAADGQGTFNVIGATANPGSTINFGPEGVAFVPLGSPLFSAPSVLVTEWSDSTIVAYALDANGNPKPSTRAPIITGLGSIEGGTFDPVSGDFLFSGYTSGHIYALRGFTPQYCYANCDGSTTSPVLTANDFQCFLNFFAAGNVAANCDGSTVAPTLNANDFQCFLNKFAMGCAR